MPTQLVNVQSVLTRVVIGAMLLASLVGMFFVLMVGKERTS